MPPAEDASFLDAIVAAPNDDAPRLIYADHLLESDDPKRRAHGEYIITQCALARRPRRSEEWRRLRDRERALEDAVRVGSATNVFGWSRGFPTGVVCWPGWLEDAHVLMRRIPFVQLALRGRRGDPRVATLGELAWAARNFPQLEGVVVGREGASATLDAKRLGGLRQNDQTPAWREGELPHVDIRDAIVELHLADDVAAYVDQPLPALSRLTLRSADGPAMQAMSKRTLTSLAWLASDDAQLVSPPIGAGLETLVARARLDRALADAIASSGIERLSLVHDANEHAVFTPPPNLRQLTLRFLDANWPATRCFRPGPYEALEELRLERVALDGSFGDVSLPALSRLELTESVVDPAGTAALVAHPDLAPLYRPSFARCVLSDPAALRARWSDVVIGYG